MEDDVQLPVLTLSTMMFGQPKLIPEQDLDEEDADLRKRARYLRRCKDVLWSRWTGEYLKSLKEKHNLKHKTKDITVQPGDVVLIQGSERNRGKWNSGIVVKLNKGRNGVVRAIRLRTGRSYLGLSSTSIRWSSTPVINCENNTKKGEERVTLIQVRGNFVPQEERQLQLQTTSVALHNRSKRH